MYRGDGPTCRTASGYSFCIRWDYCAPRTGRSRKCAVRSLLRHRESLVEMAATLVNHMQKALDQMNLQVHHVISDITGQTGLAIVVAILGGERNPQVLAKLRHERMGERRSHRQVLGRRLQTRTSVHVTPVPDSLSQLSVAYRRL